MAPESAVPESWPRPGPEDDATVVDAAPAAHELDDDVEDEDAVAPSPNSQSAGTGRNDALHLAIRNWPNLLFSAGNPGEIQGTPGEGEAR